MPWRCVWRWAVDGFGVKEAQKAGKLPECIVLGGSGHPGRRERGERGWILNMF